MLYFPLGCIFKWFDYQGNIGFVKWDCLLLFLFYLMVWGKLFLVLEWTGPQYVFLGKLYYYINPTAYFRSLNVVHVLFFVLIFIYFYVYRCFCSHMSVYPVGIVPMEVRRGCKICWGWLWARTKLRISANVSSALNYWAISPAPSDIIVLILAYNVCLDIDPF